MKKEIRITFEIVWFDDPDVKPRRSYPVTKVFDWETLREMKIDIEKIAPAAFLECMKQSLANDRSSR